MARPAGSEPPCLATPGRPIQEERRLAARKYFRSDPAADDFVAFEFKAYRMRAVTLALAALFKGKCAYCERDIRAGADGEIEHFRPKGGVEGELHPGYWWLAHSWSNMLPSCKACNQRRRVNVLYDAVSPEEFDRLLNRPARESHGKKNYFPIAGARATHRKHDLDAEDPLLIDPTVRDPAQHLTWHHGGHQVLVRPRVVDGVTDPRGRESIKAFALNRVPLIAARNAALKVLRSQRTQTLDQLARTRPGTARWRRALDRALEDVRFMRTGYEDDQEFTAMIRAFVEDFEAELRGMRETDDAVAGAAPGPA